MVVVVAVAGGMVWVGLDGGVSACAMVVVVVVALGGGMVRKGGWMGCVYGGARWMRGCRWNTSCVGTRATRTEECEASPNLVS